MGVTMNLHALFVLSIVALAAPVAAPSQAANPATDGLVLVHSRNLDEFYLRPNSDLAGYRRVMIDPAQVAFRKDWNKQSVDLHGVTRRLREDDVRRLADDPASRLQSAVAEAFTARGYEIATAPGPGVLRLSPSVTDLYVNAAEDLSPGTTKSFTKDAGEATLLLEARDAATGMLLGRVVDHRTARETRGIQARDLIRTSSVSDSFWFETMFRRWAANCVTEFEAAKNRL
jgi:hypothetical protein